MTGFEYAAAVGMMYEGMPPEGIKIVENIRDRYDGKKRSPFDEAECGHHYARAMASWAANLALSGFHYSAIDKSISFTDKPGNYFWSNGFAWGMAKVTNEGVEIRVDSKSIDLKTVYIGNKTTSLNKVLEIKDGQSHFFLL
jgi:hypothetical protein